MQPEAHDAISAMIAIVDDDIAVCDSLKWLFASRNHKVVAFDSAEAFLADEDPSRFGCLLLDLGMHGMGGIELMQTIQSKGYCPPVVFLTGRGNESQATMALNLGAMDFVDKPFDDNALVVLAERCLRADVDARIYYFQNIIAN